jgi:hypothetical protein
MLCRIKLPISVIHLIPWCIFQSDVAHIVCSYGTKQHCITISNEVCGITKLVSMLLPCKNAKITHPALYVDIIRHMTWRQAWEQNRFSIPSAFNGSLLYQVWKPLQWFWRRHLCVFTELRFINLHTVIISSFVISSNYSTSHGILLFITYYNYDTLFITKLSTFKIFYAIYFGIKALEYHSRKQDTTATELSWSWKSFAHKCI